MTNDWCRILGIDVPDLAAVVPHREANTFALLLVALLESGRPMTLREVAARFAAAGVGPEERALLSLQRCKPARPPVYRDGEHYYLDPHDDELDLWAFRLGLRPPKFARPAPPPPPPAADPGPDVPLTEEELDLAWKDQYLSYWSAQRLALAALDAAGGPRSPAEVVAMVSSRAKFYLLREDYPYFAVRGSPVAVLPDGRWAIAEGADALVRSARKAVRARVAMARKYAAMRPDPAAIQAHSAFVERQRAAHAAELAALRRALLVVFPPAKPEAVALVDVDAHAIETFVGPAELEELRRRLARYEVLGAVEVRALLRALDVEAGERRLAELGPPQKSKQLNRRGRSLKITTALLVQGSCGIARPFGDDKVLAGYLAAGQLTKLRRRLEADAKSLFALYEYGRLQGCVRLRWGFLDETIPAPWVHRDERTIWELMRTSEAMEAPLEVVLGTAPGWVDPWSRVERVRVVGHPRGWGMVLVDEEGLQVDRLDVQRARLGVEVH